MREQWTDHLGRIWLVPQIKGRLKMRSAGHAALREFVLQRARYRCEQCGCADLDSLVADHIVSRRNGGSHHPNNLQCLCQSCNSAKVGLVDRHGPPRARRSPMAEKSEDRPVKTGRYRKVEVRTWGDAKFRALSPIPPCGQGLWLFLITGPHTSPIPGLFRAGRAGMAEELGWEQEAFDKAFQEALDQEMVEADFKARVVWIPKAISHNRPESPNVVKSWGGEFDLIPECDLKWKAFEVLRASIHAVGEAFGVAFDESFRKASGKPLPKAKANQKQEQEQKQEGSDPIGSGGEPPSDPEALRAWLREQVFASGVALLTAADVTEKNARSMLAMLCKRHGEQPVLDAIAVTAREHPGEPVSWLQAVLAPKPARASQQAGGKYAAAAQAVFGTPTEVIDV